MLKTAFGNDTSLSKVVLKV